MLFRSFKVTPSSDPHRFHYELVVQHLTKEHRVSTGKVNVTVTGMADGKARSYGLSELSAQVTKQDIPLKLRFYQTIAGDLVLPEGFQPQYVDILAEKSGGVAVTARFDWVVKSF